LPLKRKKIVKLALLVATKQERAAYYATILRRAGVRTVLAQSVSEAKKILEQELPHFVISENNFADGDAGHIASFMADDTLLTKVSLFIIKDQNTRAAIYTKHTKTKSLPDHVEPSLFLSLIEKEYSENVDGLSPFYMPQSETNAKPEIEIEVDGYILGIANGFLIFNSHFVLHPHHQVQCTPAFAAMDALSMRQIICRRFGTDVFHLFPLRCIKNQGSLWLHEVRSLIEPDYNATFRYRVLYLDHDAKRARELAAFLSTWQIELQHAKVMDDVQSILLTSSVSFQCIFVNETVATPLTSLKRWRDDSPHSSRAGILVSHTDHEGWQDDMTTWLPHPYSLTHLVEHIVALSQDLERLRQLSLAGEDRRLLPIKIGISGNLLGFDETGIHVAAPVEFTEGSTLRVKDEEHAALLGHASLTASKTVAVDDELCHSHLLSLPPGTSKSKYLLQLIKRLGVS